MHPYRKFILTYTSISDQDWDRIEACIERCTYEKGELLLEERKICQHLYFLESGFLRFFTNKDGVSVSKFFTEPPYALTSQRSFTQQLPAEEGIETLEKSVLWKMNRTDAYDLFDLPSWSTFVRKLVQEVQYFTEQILVDLQNQTAEERYFHLIETNSILLEKVPLKHLATFLGIAPQSLSRIRKKYYEKKKLT